MPQEFIQDPHAKLDYKYDWRPLTNGVQGAVSDWLAVGETIASYVITADSGITTASPSLTDGNTSVTLWVSGGEIGKKYAIGCKIVTSATPVNRRDERSIYVTIRNR